VKRLILLLLFTQQIAAIEYPSAPQEPSVPEPQVNNDERPGRKDTKKAVTKSVPLLQLRVKIHLGDKSVLTAQVNLPATYSFTHKKGQIQYQQTIRAEDIRELVIESYRARKIATDKDGEVFEFDPAGVRIELKDGQSFRLSYLFKELRKLPARNEDGAFSVFAFFADTYRKKGGWQERPGEAFSVTSRTPHPGVYTRLEYFEPVDKAGAEK